MGTKSDSAFSQDRQEDIKDFSGEMVWTKGDWRPGASCQQHLGTQAPETWPKLRKVGSEIPLLPSGGKRGHQIKSEGNKESFPSGWWGLGTHLQLLVGIKRRQWHPTPVLLPGKFHGWRSLLGYSPWGHKESDMTERLHFLFTLNFIAEKTFSLMHLYVLDICKHLKMRLQILLEICTLL